MGRRKSVYEQGQVPKFKYYKNRKTYFSNASKYVTHEEARQIIAECDGNFEVTGIEKDKFLLKILSAEIGGEVNIEILFRAVLNGGFINYIRKLELGRELIHEPVRYETTTSSEVTVS